MNQQEATSVGSSVLLYLLGIAATSLVTKGVMTQDQANALVPEIVTVLIAVISVGVIYWKKRQHSPDAVAAAVATTPAVASAVVKTVNSDAVPGVKVVSDMSASPQVIVDLKGNVRIDPAASIIGQKSENTKY